MRQTGHREPQSGAVTRRLLLAGAPALVLPGCTGNLLGPPEAGTIYTLHPAFAPAPGERVDWALAVMQPDMPQSLDTDRIALIQADGTMDYYAKANYPDRLSAMVQRALLDGFEASGRIAQVAREQDALHADYNLIAEVKDFEAKYAAPDTAPQALAAITVKLVTARGRKVAGTFTTTQTANAQVNSVAAAAQALGQALGAAVSAIVGWTLAAPSPTVPR
ncbi:MAG TPA: ABC-type transport auxiliary lipoprotein family protein [Rhizomicrobium sp.]|jgi:cholesterol transport system auxiliary component|nr:ABC-type transport auxiliary lipoprotein family protein [Rhizomicrobium sp.]